MLLTSEQRLLGGEVDVELEGARRALPAVDVDPEGLVVERLPLDDFARPAADLVGAGELELLLAALLPNVELGVVIRVGGLEQNSHRARRGEGAVARAGDRQRVDE